MSFKYYGQDVSFDETIGNTWHELCIHICETLINAGVLMVSNTQGFNPNKYQVLARRTQSDALCIEDKRRHALFGLASEVGEIMSLFQHEYQGKPADKQKVIDECGDLCWFLCELLDSYFCSLSDVMCYNIGKLKARYPQGFDPERSERRHEHELPKPD